MPPLAVFCVAWLMGIIFGRYVMPSPIGFALTALGSLSLSVMWRRSHVLVVSALAVVIFILGAWRAAPVGETDLSDDISRYAGDARLTLIGVITGPPDIRDAVSNLRVTVDAVARDDDEVAAHGTVLVRASRYCDCTLGDRVKLQGRLELPRAIEGFDYPAFLAQRGIHSVMYFPAIHRIGREEQLEALSLVEGVRKRLATTLASALPEPHASLAAGVLLGLRADLPPELLADFNRTGTSHILAMSGYNTTMVVVFLMAFATPVIGRRRAAALGLAGVIVFCVLTGATPSVVRATIMSGLSVSALLFGRQRDGLVALALAAALMVGYDPHVAGDVGFQLSFAATGVLVGFGPLVNRMLNTWSDYGAGSAWPVSTVRGLLDATCITLLASVATLPLMGYHFGSLPSSGLFANLFLSPVMGPALLTSALLAVLGQIWAALAGVASGLAWAPLSYMIVVVQGCAQWPLSSLSVPPFPSWAVWLFFGGVWIAWLGTNREVRDCILSIRARLRSRASAVVLPRWVPFVLGAGAVMVWSVVLTRTDEDLHVFFLDVGQGDAIFVRGAAGKVLIDGGPSPERILTHLGRLMPFWDHTLDYVVLSHAHADHATGLVEVLERFDVRGTVEGTSRGDDAVYRRWEELSARDGRQRLIAEPGLLLRVGDQADLKVLNVPARRSQSGSVNDDSLALRLTTANASILLMGDLSEAGQADLLASTMMSHSDIFKVPHHGSQNSVNEELLRLISPRVSVISVGADNRFGHPAVSTLDVLSRTLILRTDERGTIDMVVRGEAYWLNTER